MKKLLLCAIAIFGVAASIFGGYYYFTSDEREQARVLQSLSPEENKPTDEDVPFKRRGGAWFSEDGTIRENGLADALSQRDNYLLAHMPPNGFGDKGDARPIPGVPTNWIPRGPQNSGGRTEAIVLHPDFATNGILWAGGSTGGVWRGFMSETGKIKWVATNTNLDNYNVSCLAIDPDNPKILYAGTGQSDGASLLGGGVFKSTNEGMTWARMTQTYEMGWRAVNGISVVHDNSTPPKTILLAAVENYDYFNASLENRGIMRSENGGATWQQVKDTNGTTINTSGASFVGFHPDDPAKAIAATCNRDFDADPGKCKAWYSINYGQNWAPSSLARDENSDPGCPPTGVFETCRERDSIHVAFQKPAPGYTTTIYAQYREGIAADQTQRTVLSKSANGGVAFSTDGMTGIPDGINLGVHAFWVSPQLTASPNSITVLTNR